jgi:predicted permease
MIDLLRRLATLFRRSRIERELNDEIRFHIDQQTDKNVRAGMSTEAARRSALVRFGGVDQTREATRDEFRAGPLEDFGRDLRFGARVLWRAPGFAAIAILTLGLGIGAATAVFSVVDGVLLKPLPYPNPDRIVRLFQVGADGRRGGNVSDLNFEDWKQSTHSFAAMAEMSSSPQPAVVRGQSDMIAGAAVSRDFFDVMGVRPAIGRPFESADQHVGAAPVAIVSHGFWQDRLGRGPLNDDTIRVGTTIYRIVGVMPPGFDYPAVSDYWTPRELTAPAVSRTSHNWQVVGRLSEGVALSAAQADISTLSRGLKAKYGDDTWMFDAAAVPLREQLTATSRATVMMLFGAALGLLVIACLNVSNLLLARAATRRRELALRMALGSGRWRVVRQLLAEAAVLCSGAGGVGVLIAVAGVRALVALQPGNLPRIDNVGLSWTVLAFAIGASLLAAVAITMAASLRTSDHDLRAELNESERTTSGSRATLRVREVLSAVQVALTIVVLIGAGLLSRSFIAAMMVDPGYRTSGTVILDLAAPYFRNADEKRRQIAMQDDLLARVAALPGVSDASIVSSFPLGSRFYPDGQFIEMTRVDEFTTREEALQLGDQVKARAGLAGYRIASENYFKAMGIPLIRGRVFNFADGPDAPHVAVISESLAKARWPGQDPIGRFIQFGNMDGDRTGFRIVGVVGDVRELSTETLPGPLFYGNYRQRGTSRFSVVLRADAIDTVAPAVRQIVRQLDPDIPVQTRRVEDSLDRALAGRRFSMTLIVTFGVLALALAAMGIYGLLAYLVTERRREIGVRMALGASSRDLLGLIVGRSAKLALAGVAAGVIVALSLAKVVNGLLFAVDARDPVAFAVVIAVTIGVVLLASYFPARKALKVTPVESLRS